MGERFIGTDPRESLNETAGFLLDAAIEKLELDEDAVSSLRKDFWNNFQRLLYSQGPEIAGAIFTRAEEMSDRKIQERQEPKRQRQILSTSAIQGAWKALMRQPLNDNLADYEKSVDLALIDPTE